MASTSTVTSSTQIVTLPHIAELYDPNFLDVLIPAPKSAPGRDVTMKASSNPRNPMMDALESTATQTLTENGAPAYSSTGSATLDAFQLLAYQSGYAPKYNEYLEKAWAEDPELTLRLIWNIRSIHDGKAERKPFYQAFGWLYDNHPRTAISNLHFLVEPVCKRRKSKESLAHGYWKDLLNILALATIGDLNTPLTSTFLSANKEEYVYNKRKTKTGTPESRIQASLDAGKQNKIASKEKRKQVCATRHEVLLAKLKTPKYRALYIAIARLFAERLRQDLEHLAELDVLDPGARAQRIALQKQISLAGKWAATPGGSHDRHTNITTAIALLLHRAQTPSPYPAALTSADPQDPNTALLLRSFFQRWVLTPLRRAIQIPEPLMCAQRWSSINYSRVSAMSMNNNADTFFAHDPIRFEAYLADVERGRKTISGATLLPHELVAEAFALENRGIVSERSGKHSALAEAKRRVVGIKMRVVEQQWDALITRLREAGSLENAIAVCDVSGSMGPIGAKLDRNDVLPIFPAVALSLVLAHLAQPPFDGGFITFSKDPKFVKLDMGPGKTLGQRLVDMVRSDWGANTDFQAVFTKLLLPLAVKHEVKKEDMIKRIFVFSDMQFDEAGTSNDPAAWETNYDAIEKAYNEAGYEVPQIVFWDVRRYGPVPVNVTVEVQADRKGVAMMNGFSPAMLKVFMGEEEEEDEDGWNKVGKDGEEEKEEFTPFDVMKKALMKECFDGLVVVD